MTLTQINKAGLDELALDHVFTIGASGTDHYTFQGEGLNGTVNDPTLYLTRGKTYRFENGSGGHPIRIQSTSGASGTAYNTGVTNNAGSGTVIVEVQHDAPDVLYYQCTSHANMNGTIYVTGALADGNVTTAKLADDAVTDAKLANSINTAIAANTAKTTNATHTGDVTGSTSLTIASNAVTTAKIADDAVTTAKIAAGAITNSQISANAIGPGTITSNAVTTAKIADEAVTLAKLPHGTGSNDGKFLRANNGADPTFESVPSPAITAINNATNNRILTSEGGTTVNSEANLTFNGGRLVAVQPDSDIGLLVQNSSHNSQLRIECVATGKNSEIFFADNADGDVGKIDYDHNDNSLSLTVNAAERMRINSSGDVGIGTNSPQSNGLTVEESGGDARLQVRAGSNGASGVVALRADGSNTQLGTWSDHDLKIVRNTSIKASVTSNGLCFNSDTAAANALDDYEEGTWTPTLTNVFAAGSNRVCLYRKIGQMVFITFDIYAASSNMDICTS